MPGKPWNRISAEEWTHIAHSMGFETERQMFETLYARLSLKAMDRKLGISHTAIRRRLRELGIPLRTRGGCRRRRENPDTIKSRIKRLGPEHTEGCTTGQLSQRLGCSVTYLCRILKALDYPYIKSPRWGGSPPPLPRAGERDRAGDRVGGRAGERRGGTEGQGLL